METSVDIPIFCASDDNYAPFLTGMMYSVLKNTKSHIAFYVLDGGITDQSKKLIELSLKLFKNYSIKYFDMSKFALNRFPNIRHYSLNTFSRYFIPELASDLGKVLYMDVDIIVKGDISELYNQNIENYPVGAVLEDFYEGNYTVLKEKIYPQYNGGDKYFNAGVLLLDIQKFVKNNYSDKLIQLTIDLCDKLNCPDQDVFNILFENNFKILDYKYNYMPDHIYMLKKKHPDLEVEPLVIHYTGKKPWKGDKGLMADEFEKIFKATSFYNIVKNKYAKSSRQFKLFGVIPLITIEED